MTPPAIEPADAPTRRRAIGIVAVGAVVGGFLIWTMEHWLAPIHGWVRADPSQRLWVVLLVLALLMAVPMLGVGAYLWRLGARVVAARRFPLPRHRVVHDTVIVEGPAAVTRGRWLKVLGLGLALAAAALGFMIWRLAALFSPGVGRA